MDLTKFTERARGFVQSAQSIAVREDHQRLDACGIQRYKIVVENMHGRVGPSVGTIAHAQLSD